jgi:hypothetical protein
MKGIVYDTSQTDFTLFSGTADKGEQTFGTIKRALLVERWQKVNNI